MLLLIFLNNNLILTLHKFEFVLKFKWTADFSDMFMFIKKMNRMSGWRVGLCRIFVKKGFEKMTPRKILAIKTAALASIHRIGVLSRIVEVNSSIIQKKKPLKFFNLHWLNKCGDCHIWALSESKLIPGNKISTIEKGNKTIIQRKFKYLI